MWHVLIGWVSNPVRKFEMRKVIEVPNVHVVAIQGSKTLSVSSKLNISASWNVRSCPRIQLNLYQ